MVVINQEVCNQCVKESSINADCAKPSLFKHINLKYMVENFFEVEAISVDELNIEASAMNA